MPVFAAAIFRAMTMCCQYLEYCQLQNTGTTCTEYQQSTKYKKLSSFGGRGGRSNCKLSKPSILHSSKYCSEFGFNIAILLRLFLPYCSCKILYPYTAERRDVLENTLPEPQEISRAEVGVFSNASRLEAVYGHSFRISREVLILWCDNRWL